MLDENDYAFLEWLSQLVREIEWCTCVEVSIEAATLRIDCDCAEAAQFALKAVRELPQLPQLSACEVLVKGKLKSARLFQRFDRPPLG